MSESKLWANSGDSHSLGERAVWDEILPKELAERMPRSEKFDGTTRSCTSTARASGATAEARDEEGRRARPSASSSRERGRDDIEVAAA